MNPPTSSHACLTILTDFLHCAETIIVTVTWSNSQSIDIGLIPHIAIIIKPQSIDTDSLFPDSHTI